MIGPDTVRLNHPWFREARLLIAWRARTKLVDGLDRQVQAGGDALDSTGYTTTTLRGVLCFTRADLPLIGVLEIRGHLLLYRKALAKRLSDRARTRTRASGRLTPSRAHSSSDAVGTGTSPSPAETSRGGELDHGD